MTNRATLVLMMLFLFQTLNFFDKLVFGLTGSAFFLLFSVTGTLVGLFVIGRVRTKWVIAGLAVV